MARGEDGFLAAVGRGREVTQTTMTQEQSTRRRCVECGRFRATEATDDVCWACRAAGNGRTAAPIEAPKPLAALRGNRAASSGSSSAKPKPPRGVVILRPSQLHPDAPPLLAPRETSLPSVRPLSDVASRDVTITPTDEPLPALRPDLYRMTQQDSHRIAQPDPYRTAQPESRPAVEWGKWALRAVVGVGGGILIGMVIPFLLSR